MYKLSNFNVYKEDNASLTIYNTLSSGILELDTKRKKEFLQYANNNECLTDELLHNLIKGRMLINVEDNELAYIDLISKASRLGGQGFGLTIAPTLECNFICPYCYEKGHRYNTMTEDILEGTIKFIHQNMIGKNELHISWYGGEPLLAIDMIEKITKSIVEHKYNYFATMVSNGYLLTKAMAQKLKELNISNIQITIDGPESIHNQRRILKSGEGSYQQILNNIVESCEIINTTIRVNVDKDNIHLVDKLLDDLDTKNLQGKIKMYLAPIDNINDVCNGEKCFTSEEFAKEQMRFYNKHHNRGYVFIDVPLPRPGICGAVNLFSYVVDPLGDLYKCWDNIGHKNEKVGNISKPIKIEGKLLKWLSHDCLTDHDCRECKVLPVCMGGCPNKAITFGSEGKNCDHLKYVSDDYLSLIKKSAQQSQTNKNL